MATLSDGTKVDNRTLLAALSKADDARKQAFLDRLSRTKPKPGSAAELSAKIDKLIELLNKQDSDKQE
jgi:hypothetical protein